MLRDCVSSQTNQDLKNAQSETTIVPSPVTPQTWNEWANQKVNQVWNATPSVSSVADTVREWGNAIPSFEQLKYGRDSLSGAISDTQETHKKDGFVPAVTQFVDWLGDEQGL